MTKEQVLKIVEQVFDQAGESPIKGMLFALTTQVNETEGGLQMGIEMTKSDTEVVISHLQQPVGEPNPLEAILKGLSDNLKDVCPCPKCVARRAAGVPKVSVMSLQDFIQKMGKSSAVRTDQGDQADSPKSLSELAAEARANGLTMDEFLDSLMQVK